MEKKSTGMSKQNLGTTKYWTAVFSIICHKLFQNQVYTYKPPPTHPRSVSVLNTELLKLELLCKLLYPPSEKKKKKSTSSVT